MAGVGMGAGQKSLRLVMALVIVLAVGGRGPISAQQQLPVTLIAVTSPVGHGNAASISVKTAPGSACTITVTYKSGPSRAKGLTPKAADAHGMVRWTWIVGTRTTPGKWPIDVTCSAGGKSGILRTFLIVE